MPKVASAKRAKKPKTVLDKVVAAIIALDNPKGSSRQAITKYVKEEFDLDNPPALKRAFKAGVSKGRLEKARASFLAVGHTPTPAAPEPEVGIVDKKAGAGPEAAVGDTVTVSYVGRLAATGTEFERGSKFSFVLGAGDVIKGWDQGCVGMRQGGVRDLAVPACLAYGKRGAGADIPPNSDLLFRVTMKAIESG